MTFYRDSAVLDMSVFGPPPAPGLSDEDRRDLLLEQLGWTLGQVRQWLEHAESTLAKLTEGPS